MKALFVTLILCLSSAGASAAIVLSDTFTYPDGVLTNVSNGKWRHTSGGANEVNVTNGVVELTRSETEDVAASLATSYSASSGVTLYSRFILVVSLPPAGANGNYFTHFDGGSARARVFLVTNGAAAGHFRLGIGNGGTTASTIWPVDLDTNHTYLVMTRLVVSNAQATLWVNPNFESDTSITASDAVSASSANAFAWRQDTGMGVLIVDNLFVATSFGEALYGDETPSISHIPDQQLADGGMTAAIPFTIGDAESPPSSLSLSARLSTTNVINVSFGGGGSNRTVTVTAIPNQTNTTTVTVLVTDNVTTNSDSFIVTIVPSLLFSDDFNYSDGALITNATPPWMHHSGAVTGQVQIANGKIVMSSLLTEDVNVALPRGPFATNSGVTLYASFVVNFSQLPGPTGDYFAHFNTTGARCRVFANTANAGSGKFRLGLANGGNSVSEQLAMDLSTNTPYRVALKYDPATAISKLWINPAAEVDGGTNATDVTTASAISTFAFREDPGIGTFTVDDLRIGLTFASVTDSSFGPLLRIDRVSNAMRLAWPVSAVGFVLQSNSVVKSTNWQDVAQPPEVVGSDNVITNPMSGASLYFRLKK